MRFFPITLIREIALSTAVSVGLSCFMAPAMATAAPDETPTMMQADTKPSAFVKKSKSIRGAITIVERDGQRFVRFSETFKAKSGPDLKVFLSPHSVKAAKGRNATKGAVKLGKLARTKGSQEYAIPAHVVLDDFASVLVHCEAYAVLWGAAAI